MLQPKKTKFRKQQKGRIHGFATRGAEISFGSFALKSLDPSGSLHVKLNQLVSHLRVT